MDSIVTRFKFAITSLIWLMWSLPAYSDGVVLAHPPLNVFYSCSEHWAGQFDHVGDALGTDCLSEKLITVDDRTWTRSYKGEGRENSDWYSWLQPVYAPASGQVIATHVNPVTNQPGIMGEGRASLVHIQTEDGTNFLVAHLENILVQKGDLVTSGQQIASVGNNGYSRNPHVHLAAWRDGKPLQIRFDQTKMKPLLEEN